MRKFKILIVLTIFLTASTGGSAFAQKLMSVQVKKGQLRSKPAFMGKILATISYTEQVDILEEKGDWFKVQWQGREGWMHASALTKKKIIRNPGADDIELAASGDEVALAGKGFNADVEEQLKNRRGNLNYQAVDDMEKTIASPDRIRIFLQEGNLSPEGGSL